MIDKKESIEDYLEHIIMLKEKREIVKAVDLANFMGFSKASVSIALKKLKADEFLYVEANGNIVLTEKGEKLGNETYDKHKTISKLLIQIGVDSDIALKDACRIEHVISDQTFEAIKKYEKDR